MIIVQYRNWLIQFYRRKESKMATLSKEDFLTRLKAKIGDDTSDDTVSFLEDVIDTYNDLESKASIKDETDWKAKYDELDKSWREKYTQRFFNSSTEVKDEIPKPVEEIDPSVAEAESVTFDDLFE